MVNIEKPELDPKQVFDFIGYQFGLKGGGGGGGQGQTHPRAFDLKYKIQNLLSKLNCPVRQLMSLTGLLTTEKQVHLG